MIEILTILHGLLVGPIEVHLDVPADTARIEVALDGEVLAEHQGPPWQVQVPFPEVPRPARLSIEAFDVGGHSLDRRQRFINIDFADCEAPIAAGPRGAATPFLIEIAADADQPAASELAGWFEAGGKELEVLAIEKPPAELLVVQDPATQSLLDLLSVAYLAYRTGQSGTLVEKDEGAAPLLEKALQSLHGEGPDGTETDGTETDGTETVSAETETAGVTAEGMRDPRLRVAEQRAEERAVDDWRQLGAFDVDGTLRFLWPSGPPIAQLERETAIFPVIGPYDAGRSGVLWHLVAATSGGRRHRVADAVALAGFETSSTCRRRAVVLLEAAYTEDASLLEVPAVVSYLRSIQVPLFVLRDREKVDRSGRRRGDRRRGEDQAKPANPWNAEALADRDGKLDMPATAKAFTEFKDRVERTLKRQRVVWLAGRHLPSEIRFRPRGDGYTRLASRRGDNERRTVTGEASR